MSYCRWSSDNYQCDVYCYADVGGGYTTQVASRRRIPGADEYQHIGLPYDGEMFNDPTPLAMAERLQMLAKAGYSVSQYAIDALLEEAE